MIRTYGKGDPESIVRNVYHHAPEAQSLALALTTGVFGSEVARDGRVHWLHWGRGATGINLKLANDRRIAFRPKMNGGKYDRVEIIEPGPRFSIAKGTVLFTLTDPRQTTEAIAVIEKVAE